MGRSPLEVGGAFIEFNQTPGLGALITAGCSTVDAGQLALGDGVGRIPLDLLLVPDAGLPAWQAELAARAWPAWRRALPGCA